MNMNRKKQPNMISAATPGDRTEPRHARSPENDLEIVDHLLAEEHEPRHAGDRPRDVDVARAAVRPVPRCAARRSGELDAGHDEHAGRDEHAEPAEQARDRLAARRHLRHTSTSKCVDSRTPIMAPIMIVQMNMKRAISSVQM